MICFDTNEGRFNLRSVAVIIQDGNVLIHRAEADDFWALPGGRVEFFETSEEAVVRELKEELGLNGEVVRLLWFSENFFQNNSTKCHEFACYFLVTTVGNMYIEPEVDFLGIETDVYLIFRWIPLSEIDKYELYPKFLEGGLNNLPEVTEYIRINELNG